MHNNVTQSNRAYIKNTFERLFNKGSYVGLHI